MITWAGNTDKGTIFGEIPVTHFHWLTMCSSESQSHVTRGPHLHLFCFKMTTHAPCRIMSGMCLDKLEPINMSWNVAWRLISRWEEGIPSLRHRAEWLNSVRGLNKNRLGCAVSHLEQVSKHTQHHTLTSVFEVKLESQFLVDQKTLVKRGNQGFFFFGSELRFDFLLTYNTCMGSAQGNWMSAEEKIKRLRGNVMSNTIKVELWGGL